MIRKLTFLLLVVCLCGFTKSDLLTSQEEILDRARLDALSWTETGGSLLKWNEKAGLSGSYTYDLSFRDKGQMLTVFIRPDQQADIQQLALLKDRLMKQRFSFRTPKGQIYKFTHTFTF